MPMAAVTALHAIPDHGHVQAGQPVLVNSAAGGVGTFAVQLAKVLGRRSPACAAPGNVDLVRSIGATHVIDDAAEDFADGTVRYDLIVDNVGNPRIRDLRRAITPRGIVIVNGGGHPVTSSARSAAFLRAAKVNLFVRQKITMVPTTWGRGDLLAVAELVENGAAEW